MAGGYGVWQNVPGTHDCPVAGWRTENKAARRLIRSVAEEDKVEEAVYSSLTACAVVSGSAGLFPIRLLS